MRAANARQLCLHPQAVCACVHSLAQTELRSSSSITTCCRRRRRPSSVLHRTRTGRALATRTHARSSRKARRCKTCLARRRCRAANSSLHRAVAIQLNFGCRSRRTHTVRKNRARSVFRLSFWHCADSPAKSVVSCERVRDSTGHSHTHTAHISVHRITSDKRRYILFTCTQPECSVLHNYTIKHTRTHTRLTTAILTKQHSRYIDVNIECTHK